MCDFPNVENHDLELEMLSSLCEEWDRRIESLGAMFDQGYVDESLILCCCYIAAIGNWLGKPGSDEKEAFTKALLRYGDNELFGRINPVRLYEAFQQVEEVWRPAALHNRLRGCLDTLKDQFYPWEEIARVCRPVLTDEEFDGLREYFWIGTFAGLAHTITRCEGVRHGMITVRGCGDTVPGFPLFYPALRKVFDRARSLIMAGRLRIY